MNRSLVIFAVVIYPSKARHDTFRNENGDSNLNTAIQQAILKTRTSCEWRQTYSTIAFKFTTIYQSDIQEVAAAWARVFPNGMRSALAASSASRPASDTPAASERPANSENT